MIQNKIKYKIKLKKGDKVKVITGAYKNQVGQILEVFPKENKAVVEGIQLQKKHYKPNTQQPGGINTKEGKIHISNLQYMTSDGKCSRLGYKLIDNKKIRTVKKTGENLN